MDLRVVRAVSYPIFRVCAADLSDSPTINRKTRRASAGVNSNRSFRNTAGGIPDAFRGASFVRRGVALVTSQLGVAQSGRTCLLSGAADTVCFVGGPPCRRH